jgi:hypothetical protein
MFTCVYLQWIKVDLFYLVNSGVEVATGFGTLDST